MNDDLILSLDPSSQKTGYCFMDYAERIHEAGLLSAKNRMPAEIRIASMADDLLILLNHWQPEITVIETSSGKINPRRHGGKGSGIAILGIAIGRLWGQVELWKSTLAIEDRMIVSVILIRENRWIAGRSKAERQQAIALSYSQYDMSKDRGFDTSDAVSLAQWFIRERRLRLAQYTEREFTALEMLHCVEEQNDY